MKGLWGCEILRIRLSHERRGRDLPAALTSQPPRDAPASEIDIKKQTLAGRSGCGPPPPPPIKKKKEVAEPRHTATL